MSAESRASREVSPEVNDVLEEYLALGLNFKNPPQVELELLSQTPSGEENVGVRDISVSTAVQCYAPGNAKMRSRTDARSNAIAQSTLDAGHLTTRQHPTLTWKITASRSVVHDVFHAHPFYNSEQQSQRYVEAKQGNYLVPEGLNAQQEQHFLVSADYANSAYFELLESLSPEVGQRIGQMYPDGGWSVASTRERLERKTAKVCQEVARYVLPIGQNTVFDHTLNELSLLRLFRASGLPTFSDEAKYIVAKMITTLGKHDPTIYQELSVPIEVPQVQLSSWESIRDVKAKFDNRLQGKDSLLVSLTQDTRDNLVEAARVVLGNIDISEEDMLDLLLDPSYNSLLADVYDAGMHDPLTSSLRQVNATFISRVSHTADSQRQRHRRTPGATPSIQTTYDGQPDYITPLVVRENIQLREKYDQVMSRIYANLYKAFELGMSSENALLLLPNAHAIRVTESGDLFDWSHRLRQRLCLLAQEEIFFVSVDQAEQLVDALPESQNLMLAPCGIRKYAQKRPRCPEGDRWCGQPVFHWMLEKYREARLV